MIAVQLLFLSALFSLGKACKATIRQRYAQVPKYMQNAVNGLRDHEVGPYQACNCATINCQHADNSDMYRMGLCLPKGVNCSQATDALNFCTYIQGNKIGCELCTEVYCNQDNMELLNGLRSVYHQPGVVVPPPINVQPKVMEPINECKQLAANCPCGWAKCVPYEGWAASGCCGLDYSFQCCSLVLPPRRPYIQPPQPIPIYPQKDVLSTISTSIRSLPSKVTKRKAWNYGTNILPSSIAFMFAILLSLKVFLTNA